MQLAAHVFSFGEPGATGRLMGHWLFWSIGLAMLLAWVPRRHLQLDAVAHVAVVVTCLSMSVLGGFWHATNYFHRVDVTREGDLTMGYDGPRYREKLLPSRQIDAIEVVAIRSLKASPTCRLVVVSKGWQHSSVEDECRAVERARTVLLHLRRSV